MKFLKSSLKPFLLPRILRVRAKNAAQHAGMSIKFASDHVEFSKGNNSVRISPGQLRYYDTIIDQFEVYTNAVMPDEIEYKSVVDFSRPRWHVLSKSRKHVFLNGFSEGDDLIKEYVDALKPKVGMCALDLGANCGLVTMALSDSVGEMGKVVSVEADPKNFAALELNVSHLSNVVTLKAAVYDSDGEISFSSDGSMGASISSRGNVKVKTYKLDSLIKVSGLDRLDIVKMDIEGAEMLILPRASDFLNEYRATWVIEVHDKQSGKSILKNVFSECGYDVDILSDWPAPIIRCTPR